ncbi:iron chelate uptake ABC transporter family permease subunit [Arsenicicoccus dermatophilus]|uniref:iron chelate uptake ABC transporter family permease subunit n=1 Tax=Arsenicicoccus dermatophilus TaxID=1076331 RepID=UPI001F4CEC41|nr:iron ABC transporter permease [Arsenicicoccus dermatophilus]
MTARRPSLVVLLLLVLLTAVAVATLAAGRLGIPPAQQPAAWQDLLTGDGSLVMRRLRGPRLVVGLGAGACLGLAGALLQRATGNVLVTPDVLGVTAGAGAGAVVAAVLLDAPTATGSVLGAALAAVAVHVATGRGYRLPSAVIIAGIGTTAVAGAVTQHLLLVVRREEATALTAALTGSLSARTWDQAVGVVAALAALATVALTIRRPLELLALGDDAAHCLGGRPDLTRTVATVLSVALTAAAVAVAGPITFVALAAPQIARRALGQEPLLTAALTGALVVSAADLAVQQAPPVAGLPVGVVTAALGAGVLALTLGQAWRRGTL